MEPDVDTPRTVPFFRSRRRAVGLGILAALGCWGVGLFLWPLLRHIVHIPVLVMALGPAPLPLALAITLAVIGGRRPGGGPFCAALLLAFFLLPVAALLAVFGMCVLR